MCKLLVFLILTTSICQLKSQDNQNIVIFLFDLPVTQKPVSKNDGCPVETQLDASANACIITVKPSEDGCPSGTIEDDNNECVPIALLTRVAAPEVVEGGCINGQTRDPNTGECVSCPPGQERDGETNECVTIVTRRFALRRVASPTVVEGGCINGQTRDPNTGECVSCPPGQERDGETNECVTIVTTRSLGPCPGGYRRSNVGCVPIKLRRVAAPEVVEGGCINGQTRDPNTGECVSCPPGQERDGETNECVTIVTRRFALRRVASPEVVEGGCINGQTRDPNTGECVSSPPGQERDGQTNECATIVTKRSLRRCPGGYRRSNVGCIPIKLRRVAAPEVVEGGCINGQTRDPNTGECVSCPPGQERDGETNECVTIVARSVGVIGLKGVTAPDAVEEKCINGETRDPNSGECVSCPPGQERDDATNECVVVLDSGVRRLLENISQILINYAIERFIG